MEDKYLTLAKPSDALLKEKASKFFAYAFPCQTTYQVKELIDGLRVKYHDARHFCYAYRFGPEKVVYRANDDGEPSNSAGKPILGQIQAFDLTDVLIVVVRYFGGTKLGVGGLISAYKEASKLALEDAKIIEKTVYAEFEISHGYEEMNQVMRLIKERDLKMVNQELALSCVTTIGIRASEAENMDALLASLHKLTYKRL
jgi:uncharacterized YigZ family protein